MSQNIPIYIPTYINSATYSPARVLPRLFFYNGLVECESWYISDDNNAARIQNSFPYFDNYNVVTGSFPTENSDSLLFTNEPAVYGTVPNNSLYTTYWSTYISLLYNPKTRLLTCSAIIPLADYFDLELNDIVNFRGNYYHLRAVNNYSLKTGECDLQLLGPIISDAFTAEYNRQQGNTTTSTTTAGPVTTTTTFSNNPCVCTEVNITSEGGEVATFDCYGQNINYVYATAGIRYICAAEIGGLLQADIVSGTGTVSPVGNCKTGTCPPGETTTTTTQAGTTTTTTVSPTTTTSTTTTSTTTTSTTTTTVPPQILFTAASCQDIYDFNTYSAVSASYNVGDVFKDNFGTCYYILNFTGEAAVGTLTYVGPAGSCSSSECVTTTTTISPFCNTWLVENSTAAGYYYKVKYCGSTTYSYPEILPFSSQSVCVQNDQIENAFGAPISLTNLSQSCLTTTTTTLAPGCSTFVITNNNEGVTFLDEYVYCGDNFSSSYSVGSGDTIQLCVQDGKIGLPTGPNYVINISGSCETTTTTTTTLAPGCYLATIINNTTDSTFIGEYVGCGEFVSQSYSVSSQSSASFCTQDKKIDLPSGPNYTSSFSAVGGCAATTTTTTTLPPAFTNIWTADAWFDRSGFTFEVEYTGSNGLFTSSVIS